MTKPKAINREKLVAFVLPIIAKGVEPVSYTHLDVYQRQSLVYQMYQVSQLSNINSPGI